MDAMESVIEKQLTELPTPAFCVDLDVLEKNCRKMLETAKKFNVQLRPQMKTHKTVWIVEAWNLLSKTMIAESFKYCGITNAIDGSEDNLITCFKEDRECSAGLKELKLKWVEVKDNDSLIISDPFLEPSDLESEDEEIILEGGILMTGGTKRCIVVSTLLEAEFFADAGFDDILYGYPLTPDKIQRCMRLSQRLNQFHLLIDNEIIFNELKKQSTNQSEQTKWSIFLKVDCGNGRVGVWWESQEGIELARKINDSFIFAGVYVHCGNSYTTAAQGTDVQNLENDIIYKLLNFVQRLKGAGITCPTIGIGSTPSCSKPVEKIKNLTEIHPGNYIFYDAQQYTIGSCRLDEIACKVATRVVGHYPRRNELLIDCGFTGLTKQGKDLLPGGLVIFEENPELRLKDMTQEIGKVSSVDGTPLNFDKYPIGSMLFMFPYHSCATAAMYPFYNVHRNGKVVDVWKPCRGW